MTEFRGMARWWSQRRNTAEKDQRQWRRPDEALRYVQLFYRWPPPRHTDLESMSYLLDSHSKLRSCYHVEVRVHLYSALCGHLKSTIVNRLLIIMVQDGILVSAHLCCTSTVQCGTHTQVICRIQRQAGPLAIPTCVLALWHFTPLGTKK